MQVRLGDAVRLGRQRGIAPGRRAERVELGAEVAVAPDRLRQVHGADDRADVGRADRAGSTPLLERGGGRGIRERRR